MNRREFTASLAALAAVPALPLGASAAVAPAAAVPPGSYAWAQLIARAQNKCSPASLARHLHLDPATATQLFETMVRDGVLRAPGSIGIAQATHPIDATGQKGANLAAKLRAQVTRAAEGAPPAPANSALVKAEDPALGCRDQLDEEDQDASANQSLQESPRSG